LKKLVIAIDGPAASGKSSTSKLIASRLGYLYVDTGAMYRAMTLKILSEDVDLDDAESISRVADDTKIELARDGDESRILLDGRDVTSAIRSQTVTKAVSAVSMVKKVREVMVREQRRMGAGGGIVLEGRDIGTVVFPNADLKVFMVADVERRAQRRQKELEQQGVSVSLEELTREIAERDRKDSGRNISPLRRADDAVIVDTSDMTIKEQVEFVVAKAKELLRST
jgi:cytidylate kinase